MGEKIRVGILFGGRSAEHEVSLQSAKNIIEVMDHRKYEIIPIYIDKKGTWYLKKGPGMSSPGGSEEGEKGSADEKAGVVPGEGSRSLIHVSGARRSVRLDVAFPVLHGPFGEDGTVQGLLKLADIPFVGADVLGSSVGMDKDVMKRVLRDASIPVADFVVLDRETAADFTFEDANERLGMPVFVKPANLGSSVGISRVDGREDLIRAVNHALEFDLKILVEQEIKGREIECAVLGNENPEASLPGEIRPRHAFYSYRAKYIDQQGALLDIPARLPEKVTGEVRAMAVKVFKILCCEGMARVDFFLTDAYEIVVNEINTIPGFTRISMYPKLWEATGVTYGELIDRLIESALERGERARSLKSSLD